jgi:hypothetical protein
MLVATACLTIGTVAAVSTTAASASTPATHATAKPTPSIVGKWNFEGGVFGFSKEKGKNVYIDKVYKQRPGIFCPSVNDKSGQIVLEKVSALEYKGKWKWFYSDCAFAGWGTTVVTLSKSGATAKYVGYAPKGTGGITERFTLKRLK